MKTLVVLAAARLQHTFFFNKFRGSKKMSLDEMIDQQQTKEYEARKKKSFAFFDRVSLLIDFEIISELNYSKNSANVFRENSKTEEQSLYTIYKGCSVTIEYSIESWTVEIFDRVNRRVLVKRSTREDSELQAVLLNCLAYIKNLNR